MILRLLLVVLSLGIMSDGVFAAGTAKAGGGGEGSGAKEYVKLDPLMLPIVDQDGVYQMLSMVVVIEVDGVLDADKVRAKKPRLKDAYIQDMYGALHEHSAIKGGVVQVNIIKKRLNHITDEVMEHEVDAEVLLQVIQQRPI